MQQTLTEKWFTRRAMILSGLSTAGGLMISFSFAAETETAGYRRVTLADGQIKTRELTAFLVIDLDNTITIRLPHQEMGQGVGTGHALLVAEELECDWSKIRLEYASANRNAREGGKLYGRMTTVGSRGVRDAAPMMQQAGASARERLRLAAAQLWNVDASNCVMEPGRFVNKISNHTVSYGELAPAGALIELAAEPSIKLPEKFKLVGTWTRRLDTLPKLSGAVSYGIDAQVPNMVYAAIKSCPEFGGKLKAVDETPVKGRRGVLGVVKMDDAVAVVADRYWRAKWALDLLKPQWADGGNATLDSAQMDRAYRDALDGPMATARNEGDAAAALAVPGARVIEALYEVPHLSHAPMEPMNCTVQLQPDRVDVWIGTQAPMNVLEMAAKESEIAPENVYVHNTYVGGGFGRRTQHDELVHAIACAKVVKRPVKLIWHREQDISRDRYRPQAAIRFKAVLDENGKATTLSSRVAVDSIQRSLGNKVENGIEAQAVDVLATHPYKIPNIYVGLMLKNTNVPVMPWRSVGSSQNSFFLESFIDELAHEAGQDPYQFRRSMLLERPDFLAVIDTLAKYGNWGEPLPARRGRGIAIVQAFGSVTGQVHEVTVSPEGKVTVDRVVAAINPYHPVNPNTIAQQIEGGVAFGLSAALYGEITFKNGAPVQKNFDTYTLVRLAEMPKVEVHLAPTGGARWGGVGEPSMSPLAPALCNAIFAATGKRVRRLPLKNIDLRIA